MDSSIMPTKFPNIKLVQTTDFFYPLVDDPYTQGRIACANVLSDLYAMGLSDCDNMLMLLALSRSITKEERNSIGALMISGFNDLATEAGCLVTGGQTVVNPWFIIGGVASSVVREEEIIKPVSAVPGDVLVLTKPLGTQVSVTAHQWLHLPVKWEAMEGVITEEDARNAYLTSCVSMARLNRTAAKMMHRHGAHAATDVTGFGLLGHAQNLCENQIESVDFEIHTLPLIPKTREVNAKVGFKLMEGLSAETSGGLLVALSAEKAQAYCDDMLKEDGFPAWIIGRVVQGHKKARIIDSPHIIEVEHQHPRE
jgi:selenide,water dikinase